MAKVLPSFLDFVLILIALLQLICDALTLTGNPPPFSQYLKHKHQRLFLATYYSELLMHADYRGIPSSQSDQNKLKKKCRNRAAKLYIYRESYNERTLFNWTKESNFEPIDLLCYYEWNVPALSEGKWKRGKESEGIKKIEDILIHKVLRNPDKYRYIFQQF